MKKFIKAEEEIAESSYISWAKVKKQIEFDFHDGYDPLYELTKEGEYINDICMEIEQEQGVWLEPSVQLGNGGIWVYSTSDDHCIADNIDYASFNEAVINLVIQSKSEQDFKIKYKFFLKDIIDSHSCEE